MAGWNEVGMSWNEGGMKVESIPHFMELHPFHTHSIWNNLGSLK